MWAEKVNRSEWGVGAGATIPHPPEPGLSYSRDTPSGLGKRKSLVHLVICSRDAGNDNAFIFLSLHSRLAQLRGVDIPLFMMSSVPSSPGPCIDTSIFSMRGYRALCLACSRENTAFLWLRISAGGGRMAAAAEAQPDGGKRQEGKMTRMGGLKKILKYRNFYITEYMSLMFSYKWRLRAEYMTFQPILRSLQLLG